MPILWQVGATQTNASTRGPNHHDQSTSLSLPSSAQPCRCPRSWSCTPVLTTTKTGEKARDHTAERSLTNNSIAHHSQRKHLEWKTLRMEMATSQCNTKSALQQKTVLANISITLLDGYMGTLTDHPSSSLPLS